MEDLMKSTESSHLAAATLVDSSVRGLVTSISPFCHRQAWYTVGKGVGEA